MLLVKFPSAVEWQCTVPWVGLQCVIVGHVFPGKTQFCSFHLYYNRI